MPHTIIPSSNFQVKKLDGIRIPFTNAIGNGYILLSGWGLFDITAQAWVSMDKDGLPTGWRTKKTAQWVIHEGLIEGYKTYKP